MGRPVIANHTSPVDRESDRQILDGDIMHNLVITTLQEGRIERTERLHAFSGQTGGKGHCMLFGDADIKNAPRKPCLHLVEAGSRWHCRSDRHDLVVRFGSCHQPIGKHRGVARGVASSLVLRSGDDIEFRDSVIFFGRRPGKGMSLAFLGDHMDQNRPTRMAVADVFQNRKKMRHVMAVDRANVKKAKLAEHRIAADQVTSSLTRASRGALDLGREPTGNLAHQVTDRMKRLRGDETRQIAAHRANRLGNRHVIVIQDDDQTRIGCTGIVHALEGHTGAHRAITDHRDDIAVDALDITADSHTKTSRNRG